MYEKIIHEGNAHQNHTCHLLEWLLSKRCREKGDPVHAGGTVRCSHMERRDGGSSKKQTRTVTGSIRLTSVYSPEENKSESCVHVHVYCSFVYSSQDTETVSVLVSGWRDAENVKRENLPIVMTWVDLESIMLSEKANTLRSHLYVEPETKTKQAHTESSSVVAKDWDGGEHSRCRGSGFKDADSSTIIILSCPSGV